MRINKRERRLLASMLAILFVAGNAVGFAQLRRFHTTLRKEEQSLRTREEEAKTWLAQADLWTARAGWIKANQPSLDEVEQANPRLLNALKSAAAKQGVDITNESFLEPVNHPHYYAARVRLTCAAPLEPLARWLADLQQPDQFHQISSFSLKSDKDPSRLVCTLEVSKLYRPLNPATR